MIRRLRVVLASICLVLITALFLDFTGTIHAYFNWLADIQFVPALLAGQLVILLSLTVLTLIFGRVYCSVICPLGVMQDIIAWFGKRQKKYRYSYSPAKNWWRYGFLALFIGTLIPGIGAAFHLLSPYSTYGRIVSNLLSPLYLWGNNGLAYLAERMDSYRFYEMHIWVKSGLTLGISVASLAIIGFLAWRHGRTYCNTICPVGTWLGLFSEYSLFRVVVDEEKCNSCGLCARNCKAACIDTPHKQIDLSRCVACFDCIDTCNKGAISFKMRSFKKQPVAVTSSAEQAPKVESSSKRDFLSVVAIMGAASIAKAQEKTVDGGLADIEDKQKPERETPLLPPGAWDARRFAKHCTACQLCVTACPNEVLRPSSDITRLMQPEMYYMTGYCRPECTRCSDVCPTSALKPITREEKSSLQVGHAVWIKKNCVVLTDDVDCGNCAAHCPTGAIKMVRLDPKDKKSRRIPAIDTERCIGCGACEYVCPSRPFSAIYVEGHEQQREI